jgi:hypothetical protein
MLHLGETIGKFPLCLTVVGTIKNPLDYLFLRIFVDESGGLLDQYE